MAAAAELLRAGSYPLLVVPPTASAEHPPRRILIAADREPFALAPAASALRALPGTEVVVAHVSSGVEDDEGCALALRAVQASGLVEGLPVPGLRGYQHEHYDQSVIAAVRDVQANLVVVLARQRSYPGELFHRSFTVHLLENCPVSVLVLSVVAMPLAPSPLDLAAAAQYTNAVLISLVSAM